MQICKEGRHNQFSSAYRGSPHRRKSAASHGIDMVWLSRSRISLGRKGAFCFQKCLLFCFCFVTLKNYNKQCKDAKMEEDIFRGKSRAFTAVFHTESQTDFQLSFSVYFSNVHSTPVASKNCLHVSLMQRLQDRPKKMSFRQDFERQNTKKS